MTTEPYEDTRPLPVRYTIYSAELDRYCPDLPEDYEEWTDEMEDTLRDFADRYATELTAALRSEYPGRPVEVDVVHNTTGAGGGARDFEGREEDWIEEISNRVLERLTTGGAK